MSRLLIPGYDFGSTTVSPSLHTLWLDPDHNLTGDPVSSWISRTPGAQDFAQAVAGSRPTVESAGILFDGSDDVLSCSDVISDVTGFFALDFTAPSAFAGDQVIFSQSLVAVADVYWRILLDSVGRLCIAANNADASETRTFIDFCEVDTRYQILRYKGATQVWVTHDEANFITNDEDEQVLTFNDGNYWIGHCLGDTLSLGAAIDSGGTHSYFAGHLRHLIIGSDTTTESQRDSLLSWMENN